MRFRIVQEFDQPAERVQEAYLDPRFLELMGSLPKLGSPELLEEERSDGVVRRRIRYRFAGDLNSAVQAVIDPTKLTWVEESSTRLADLHTAWRIRPDHYADKLASSGEFQIEPAGEAGSRRIATGEVKVKVFLVGGKVESAIVSGMEEHAFRERIAILNHLGG